MSVDFVKRGMYLSVPCLGRVISQLDGAHGRWWLQDPLTLHQGEVSRGVTGMIEVFHPKGGSEQVTDESSFLIPALSANDPGNEDDAHIWVEPSRIEPSIEGLYLHNDRALTDFMQDWDRFWRPLKTAVTRACQEYRLQSSNEDLSVQVVRMLDRSWQPLKVTPAICRSIAPDHGRFSWIGEVLFNL
jgi:hypothetical protein